MLMLATYFAAAIGTFGPSGSLGAGAGAASGGVSAGAGTGEVSGRRGGGRRPDWALAWAHESAASATTRRTKRNPNRGTTAFLSVSRGAPAPDQPDAYERRRDDLAEARQVLRHYEEERGPRSHSYTVLPNVLVVLERTAEDGLARLIDVAADEHAAAIQLVRHRKRVDAATGLHDQRVALLQIG